MEFKTFVKERINYFVTHFKRNAVLLNQKGQAMNEIDLSFDRLSDQYLQKMQELESSHVQGENSTFKASEIDQGFIKITDDDLKEFWKYISNAYKQKFNIENQNITDQTVLKISELYQQQRCQFSKINLAGNIKISQVAITQLGIALRNNSSIKQINIHKLCGGMNGANRLIQLIALKGLTNIDLGLIGNKSLIYLSEMLENPHKLSNIAFGEDLNDPWKDGKAKFQQVIRKCQNSKIILAINVYPDQLIKHYDFIAQLGILCKKNRNLCLDQRQDQFKAASLNPNHHKYYDPDNHALNAYKFSVKSYLTNVFGSLLDQALYQLEKQRRNSLREEAIFEITKAPINKIILQDICTADGSIIVLTKYLLGKIQKKQQAS